MHVAVLGMGIMGAGMAHNLLKHGHVVTVWNRSRAKAEPLAAAGARVAATPAAAVAEADAVLVMVANDGASRAVWTGPEGALHASLPHAILIESSTLSLAWVQQLLQLAREHGRRLVDAPVTGTRGAAEAGELVMLVGGAPEDLEAAQPVFDAISRRVIRFGPAGSGAAYKLVQNMVSAIQLAGLAEGLALAEALGLDMGHVVPALINGSPGSPLVKGKAARMVARDYTHVEFALRWMHKDTTYAMHAADTHGVPMPTLAVVRELLSLAIQRGLGDQDMSAIAALVQRES